jgi:hypothetical protein
LTRPTRLTFDLIHLDALADIHDFDKRAFVGGDGVVHALLVPDATPVVGNSAIGVPARVLRKKWVSAVLRIRRDHWEGLRIRRRIDAMDLGRVGADATFVLVLTSGEESLTDRMLAVMMAS